MISCLQTLYGRDVNSKDADDTAAEALQGGAATQVPQC
mgnify:CR=1 FL=1